jgi:signal transduction histidine kinase/DNA-binding NarL/FixJ family response regulator
MTIRWKLFLAFAGMAGLVGLTAALGVKELGETTAALRETGATTLREVQETNRAAAAVLAVRTAIDEELARGGGTGGEATRAAREAGFRQLAEAIGGLRAEADEVLAGAVGAERAEELEHIGAIDTLDGARREWEALAARLESPAGASAAGIHDQNEALETTLMSDMLALQDHARAEISEVLEATARQAARQWYMTLAVGAAALVLAAGIACWTAVPLGRRMAAVRQTAAALGRGDLSARIEVTGRDEITALAETFNGMAAGLGESQRALVAAAERAQAANLAKSSFLANMSHEIRTPMTAIMGYAEALLDPEQTASDRQDGLQVIRRSAKHLLDVISDILDISKIEADKMTVERIPMDLLQATVDVVSLMRPRAAAKGLRLAVTFGDWLPRTVRSDPVRVKQVLMNLLGNGIKFTERGEVRLHVSCEDRGGTAAAAYDVCDTGIGMTAEQLGRLFQPFAQADESMTRRFGGTGLGLTISRRLAELLGGGLSAESVPGVGSRFRATFDGGPLAGVERLTGVTEAMMPAPQAGDDGGRPVALRGEVLLVEDGPDNQRLISMHLRRAGATVSVAENGRVGVARAAAGKFDVILMDMQMPVLDGYAAARELRAAGCTTPIIALTAHAMAEDRAKCLAAGCTDYLTKPVGKRALLTALLRYMPGADGGAGGVRSAAADDPDMKEAVAEFVGELPARVAALRALAGADDADGVRRLVHQLKGAGGGYGFDRMTELAAAAEAALRAQADVAACRREVDALVAFIESIDGYGTTEGRVNGQAAGH